MIFHEDVVLLSIAQLALFCSWLVDWGFFFDFPFDGVLNLYVSKSPNMARQGCTVLIFVFEIMFMASVALLKGATSHSVVNFGYGVALFCGDCGFVHQWPLQALAF